MADPRTETAEFYKTSGIVVLERGMESREAWPPWIGVPPDLEVYRERGTAASPPAPTPPAASPASGAA